MKLSPKFYEWFGNSVLVNEDRTPRLVYHGTSSEFSRFKLSSSTQGIIWFTSSLEKVLAKDVGAQSSGRVVKAYVRLENPAGWKEYDDLMLDQIRQQGFDGVILDFDGGFDLFVFSPEQIKIVSNEAIEEDERRKAWNPSPKR